MTSLLQRVDEVVHDAEKCFLVVLPASLGKNLT